MSEKYFIGDVTYRDSFTDTEYTAKTVSMGDGLTRVAAGMVDDSVGLTFSRSESNEMVRLTFDNIKSIDVVIEQLNCIKDKLKVIQ
jgi:hypothetical protein